MWHDFVEKNGYGPPGFFTIPELGSPGTTIPVEQEEPETVTVEDRVQSYLFGTFFFLSGDEEKASNAADQAMEFIDLALALEREEIAKMLESIDLTALAQTVRDRIVL